MYLLPVPDAGDHGVTMTNGNSRASAIDNSPSGGGLPNGNADEEGGANLDAPDATPLKETISAKSSLPQILHRNVGEENMEFSPDGLAILNDPGTDTENAGSMAWFVKVQRWRWALDSVVGTAISSGAEK